MSDWPGGGEKTRGACSKDIVIGTALLIILVTMVRVAVGKKG